MKFCILVALVALCFIQSQRAKATVVSKSRFRPFTGAQGRNDRLKAAQDDRVPVNQPDEDEQRGPAAYFFTQYYQEPWRVPESNREIFRKSIELAIASVIAGSYLVWQRKKI